MNRVATVRLAAWGVVILAAALTAAEEVRTPGIQSEPEFESLMPITGTVDTYFGSFELDHSFPTSETGDRLYDLMDHQRATQLYLWGLPLVAMERLHQNYWENFDYAYNTFVKIETFNERRGYLTANETTHYALANFNTREAAVVLDLPPGRIVGMLDDMWQESPSDVGAYGPNAGRGGRDGAKVGELMAKNLVFNERLEGVLRQNDWRYVLGGGWGDGIKGTQKMKY